MVTTTIVGAGVVAIASGATVPDLKASNYASGTLQGWSDRGTEGDRASRDGGADDVIDQGSTDLWMLPVHTYTPSSGYGYRDMGGYTEFHPGFDMACPEGTPIYAPFDGTVELAEWYAGYGYAIIINHGNGIMTLYGHQSRTLARKGDVVKAGDQIGWSGNTGYSTGPHVHYEVRINGQTTDPYKFMLNRGVDLNRKIEVIHGGVL